MIAFTSTPSFVVEAIQRAALVTVTFVENVVTEVSNLISYEKTFNQLSRLDNHQLEDIGLTHGDIPEVAVRSVNVTCDPPAASRTWYATSIFVLSW